MAASCPLNFKRVDENLSRINTLIIIILVLFYLYSSNIGIVLFLIFDFLVKLFAEKITSPIVFIGKKIKKIFLIGDEFVDGGAKRLAGFFGLTVMFLLLLTHMIGSWNFTLVVAGIYLLCALLDLFFRFCIGCKVYFMIKKIYPSFME